MTTKTVAVIIALVVIGGLGYWAYAGSIPATEPAGAGQDITNETQTPVTSADGIEPGSGGIHGMPAEPAAVAARADLAAKLGIPTSGVTIMLVEEKSWSDGCLGLGGPAESCLQALVDGFRVELLAHGHTHVYRTDKTGASLRPETNLQ